MTERPVGRIGVVNWTRRRTGGIETYVEFLIKALRDRGFAVAFLSEQDHPADRPEIPVASDVAQWCCAVDGIDATRTALRRWAPDLLIFNGLADGPLETALMADAPSVFVAHTYTGTCISGSKTVTFPDARPCDRQFGPACLAHFYPRRCGGLNPLTMIGDYSKQKAYRDQIRRFARVLTLSEHMRQEYLNHGWSPGGVTTLPQYWPGDSSVARETAEFGPTSLLFVGRLDRLKGCHLLIESLPRVRQTSGRSLRVVVAGDGPDRARCEALAARVRSADIAIEFAGWLDPAGRAAALSKAAVFVMPSVWPEPYGLSGLEAVAAGVPVASYDVGAIGEWLDAGHGALAPGDPPTSHGLAQAIVACLSMPAPPRVDVSARRTRHVDALVATIEEVIAQSPPVPA
jgi:glycosyltransferase involved in cell wall biosynthesis